MGLSTIERKLIEAYRATGRLAFHYPRLKRISLNGGRSLPEREAIDHIKEFFQSGSNQKWGTKDKASSRTRRNLTLPQ